MVLPPKTLTDYYAVIKDPISLKALTKRVRGMHGRGGTTGITDFKSWDAFETEVSKIWQNAQEYNEDGSEIFNLANDFKVDFQLFVPLEHPDGIAGRFRKETCCCKTAGRGASAANTEAQFGREAKPNQDTLRIFEGQPNTTAARLCHT